MRNIVKIAILALPLVMIMPQTVLAAGAGPSRGSVSSTRANGKRTPAPTTPVTIVNPRSSISSMNTNGRKGGTSTRPNGRRNPGTAGATKPRPRPIVRRPSLNAVAVQVEKTKGPRAVHFAGSHKEKIDKAVQSFVANTASPTGPAVAAMLDGRAPIGSGLVNHNDPSVFREAARATERRKRGNGTIKTPRWVRFKEVVFGKKR